MRIARMLQAVTVVLVVVLVSLSGGVASATTTSQTVNGNGGAIHLITVVGCISTDLRVAASVNVPKATGTAVTAIQIAIASTDVCAGKNLGTTAGADYGNFPFNADLNSASLNGMVLVFNPSGEAVFIPVSLSWTGFGTLTRTHSTARIVIGNTTTTTRTQEVSRGATVTGSVDSMSVSSRSAMLFHDTTVTKTQT